MPLTLYGYILREILKLLVASTGVLMIVMSFGFAVKPISEGLLDPGSVIKLILYTMPGMLTFAMPFGAIFASTIVFFRMSNDNEITACAVSGMSYREMLMPILALAVVLTLSMFYLSNWVVPKFWQAVASLVEEDVTKIILKKIEVREPVEIGNGLLLYADSGRDNQPIEERPAGTPVPHNRMVLDGVAVVKLNYSRRRDPNAPKGSPPLESLSMSGELTAERAVVDLYKDNDTGRTYMTLLLENVVMNDTRSGTLIAAKSQPIEAQEVESPFQQKPKFLSLPRLRKVANNPDRSAMIRKQKSKLVHAFAARIAAENMAAVLKHETDDELQLHGVNGELYFVRAPKVELKDDRVYLTATDNRKVRIRSQVNGLTHQRIAADRARLTVVANELTPEPTVNIEMEQAVIADPALPTRSVQRAEAFIPILSLDQTILAPLRNAPSQELLARFAPVDATTVLEEKKNLNVYMVKLNRSITSCLHERAAFAVNSLLVLIMGALMSMTLREQLPLAIFFWSFIPAVISILTITSGQSVFNELSNSTALGIMVTWSGNIGLLVGMGFVYRKLKRN